jgi:hypothetical protein
VIQQSGAPLDLRSAASPVTVLARDRRTGNILGTAIGVISGAMAGVGVGVVAAAVFKMVAAALFGALFGIVFGVVIGVISSFQIAAWPSYEIARVGLMLRHQLPWSLEGFLADAHRRGVLRQAGAVYQFRHIELQHRLASRNANERQASTSTA